MQNSYQVLERKGNQIDVTQIADRERLAHYLGTNRADYSALILDRYALQGQDLALILQQAQAERIQVFYRLILPVSEGKNLRLERQKLPAQGVEADYYAVQAIAEPGAGQRLQVSIFCDQREFSELEYGTRLYAEVARHILHKRRSNEHYPCYITDLDLSAIDPAGVLQTVQYLRYRQQLEDALNAAMQAISD